MSRLLSPRIDLRSQHGIVKERDWLVSREPWAMLQFILSQRGTVSAETDRKLQLFCCACFDRVGNGILALAERCDILRDIFGNPWRQHFWVHQGQLLERIVTVRAAPRGRASMIVHPQSEEWWSAEGPEQWLAWRDGTVPRLAQRMYDARDFAAMPILADALEEAGCTNEDMLMHCRGWQRAVCGRCEGDGKAHGADRPSEWSADPDFLKCPVCKGSGLNGWMRTDASHYRGCWVIDLLLGKG